MPVSVAGEPQFSNMVRQMGKMMDQMQKGYFNFYPAETWTPAVNLYENDIGYIVCVDLSGVDKEKIDLVVADGQLKLRGQRAVPETRALGSRISRSWEPTSIAPASLVVLVASPRWATGITISGRITPARIWVAPLTDARRP